MFLKKEESEVPFGNENKTDVKFDKSLIVHQDNTYTASPVEKEAKSLSINSDKSLIELQVLVELLLSYLKNADLAHLSQASTSMNSKIEEAFANQLKRIAAGIGKDAAFYSLGFENKVINEIKNGEKELIIRALATQAQADKERLEISLIENFCANSPLQQIIQILIFLSIVNLILTLTLSFLYSCSEDKVSSETVCTGIDQDTAFVAIPSSVAITLTFLGAFLGNFLIADNVKAQELKIKRLISNVGALEGAFSALQVIQRNLKDSKIDYIHQQLQKRPKQPITLKDVRNSIPSELDAIGKKIIMENSEVLIRVGIFKKTDNPDNSKVLVQPGISKSSLKDNPDNSEVLVQPGISKSSLKDNPDNSETLVQPDISKNSLKDNPDNSEALVQHGIFKNSLKDNPDDNAYVIIDFDKDTESPGNN